MNNHDFYTKYQNKIGKSLDLHVHYRGNEEELMVKYFSFVLVYQDPQLGIQKWIVPHLLDFHQFILHGLPYLPLLLFHMNHSQ